MEVSAPGMFKVQSSTCLKGLGKITEILSLRNSEEAEILILISDYRNESRSVNYFTMTFCGRAGFFT